MPKAAALLLTSHKAFDLSHKIMKTNRIYHEWQICQIPYIYKYNYLASVKVGEFLVIKECKLKCFPIKSFFYTTKTYHSAMMVKHAWTRISSKVEKWEGKLLYRGYPAKETLPAMLTHGRWGSFSRIPSISQQYLMRRMVLLSSTP